MAGSGAAKDVGLWPVILITQLHGSLKQKLLLSTRVCNHPAATTHLLIPVPTSNWQLQNKMH